MIRLEQAKKIYRSEDVETAALNGVDLAIDDGEFVAVMGPSGCGKSTLLNIIGLIDQLSDGTYEFRGENVSDYSETRLASLRKQSIGFVFQSFNLIDELTVAENVELALLYRPISGRERRKRVALALETMNIAHRADHLPQQLSGGQQQRVAIARAVVAQPKLILADEPTGNLDSQNGEEVMRLLSDLNAAGTGIIMVTHSPTHARYTHRTINLLDGQVVAESLRAV